MTRPSRYSLALKKETVRRHREDGVSVRRLAQELGAAPSTVRRWVDATRQHGGPDASFRHPRDCQCFTCLRRAYT
mgnify:CR=1 FL=1